MVVEGPESVLEGVPMDSSDVEGSESAVVSSSLSLPSMGNSRRAVYRRMRSLSWYPASNWV